MLSKGLDFKNVTLTGVMNADSLLNFPDFRAHERTYQLLVQVAGRSGRMQKRGKVIIQTFNPYHQILQQVSINDYQTMSKEQLEDRRNYGYPPFNRLIRITLKHKDVIKVDESSKWLYQSLRPVLKDNLIGPATPYVSRIRNAYIRQLMVKIPPDHSITKTKQFIQKNITTFQAIIGYRAVRVILDVDPV
jgi:primosomal protein N' (replication factor Y)